MDLQQIAAVYVEHHEGRRLSVYRDSLGVATIGVGLNLTRPGARAMVAKCGADYDALMAGAAALTSDQCDALLGACLGETIDWLAKTLPDFHDYSLPRQLALVDMGFNLGQTRFLGFKQMIRHILAEEWAAASQAALGSVWAAEVKRRAVHDAAFLREDN